jgi:patatin-related protein
VLDSVRPRFRPRREIRFAVVLYGGVSLAIYINGVVQELFRLVRATAPIYPYPDDPWTQRVYFPTCGDDDSLPRTLRGSELVYRKLAQALPFESGGPKRSRDINVDEPIRTRFVVDVLSGSSAGGINGIFLAKALANQQDIDELRRLWVDEGDIAILINDTRSYDGIPEGVERQKPPRSLLNGQRLYLKALNALSAMDQTAEKHEDETSPSYVEQLDLSVTTTDLQGLRVPIALHDRVVYEKRHRHVFHFIYAIKEGSGSFRNDFRAENDGLLAFAARATSSFPFAFEPVVLEDTAQVDESFADRFADWGDFFDDYRRRGARYERYAFADGGYLDNKPFTHATSALRRRRSADLPVDRKLVYIEPDPGGRPTRSGEPELGPAQPQPRPDVLDNVMAAAHTLPRSEPIRDDVQDVLDRNVAIEQLQRITLKVEDEFINGGETPFDRLRTLPPNARDDAVDNAVGSAAVFHRAYRNLRADSVAGELASLVAAVRGLREDADIYRAILLVIRVWIEDQHAENRNAFLFDFDFGYRVRRLKFLQDRINDLLRRGERSKRMLNLYATVLAANVGRDDLHDELQASERELLTLKLQLNRAFVFLRRKGRVVRQGEPDRSDAKAVAAIREAVDAVAKESAEQEDGPRLRDVLAVSASGREERGERQRQKAAAYVAARAAELTALETALRAYLCQVFADFEQQTQAALAAASGSSGALDVGAVVRGYFERFDSFDSISLPLQHPSLGETSAVDVMRVSPQDAISIVDELRTGTRKLAGNAFGHFGGFLDANWRRNDILWGRLDGAERILASLLPPGKLHDDLLVEAQAAILREELLETYIEGLSDLLFGALLREDTPTDAIERMNSGDPADRTALLAALRSLPDRILVDQMRKAFMLPPPPEPDEMLRVAGRATEITGKVLEDTSKRRAVPSSPWFWAARMGRLAWGVGELAMPRRRRTLPAVLFRYWTQVAILLAGVLILFGVFGVESAQKVGWTLLALVIGTRAVIWLVEAVAEGRRGALKLVLAMLAITLLGLATLEIVRHSKEDLSAAASVLPGNGDEGIENAIRTAVGDVWERIWPWD